MILFVIKKTHKLIKSCLKKKHDLLLNNKCERCEIKRVQGKIHKPGM